MATTKLRKKGSHTGQLYDMTFNYPAVCSDLTSSNLPASEPGGYTFDYTIDQTYWDSAVSGNLYKPLITFMMDFEGSRSSSGSIFYKVYKNDVVYSSGSFSASDPYWHFFPTVNGINVGDKISVKLWSNGTHAYYYNAYSIVPNRFPTGTVLRDLVITRTEGTTNCPNFTSGVITGSATTIHCASLYCKIGTYVFTQPFGNSFSTVSSMTVKGYIVPSWFGMYYQTQIYQTTSSTVFYWCTLGQKAPSNIKFRIIK